MSGAEPYVRLLAAQLNLPADRLETLLSVAESQVVARIQAILAMAPTELADPTRWMVEAQPRLGGIVPLEAALSRESTEALVWMLKPT